MIARHILFFKPKLLKKAQCEKLFGASKIWTACEIKFCSTRQIFHFYAVNLCCWCIEKEVEGRNVTAFLSSTIEVVWRKTLCINVLTIQSVHTRCDARSRGWSRLLPAGAGSERRGEGGGVLRAHAAVRLQRHRHVFPARAILHLPQPADSPGAPPQDRRRLKSRRPARKRWSARFRLPAFQTSRFNVTDKCT